MLGEINEALGYVTDWTPFVLLGVLGLFACIGAVTSLRWLIRLEYQAANRRVARQRAEYQRRRPPGNAPGLVHRTKPDQSPQPVMPLRNGPGPRDWSPLQH
ncbi:hypothetical protein [Ruicaihuangia caeni]|uniref:hypothetical protein n=1 Tax=Ruicaihuangia caeni TaxID=3042517 RepID=UPI00338E681D